MINHTKETDMPEHLTLSERIALALKHADKKQVDLAKACGVTRATVSKWLSEPMKGFSRMDCE